VTDSREKNEIIGRDTEKDQTAERQSEPGSEGNTRRYLRFKLQTEVMVYSKSGVVPGLSLEIAEDQTADNRRNRPCCGAEPKHLSSRL
jgi:hypothetical protein